MSVEEIREAVQKTYTQNQTTMSKFVLDEKGNLYLEEMPETGCKVIVDDRDWQEIMYENERKTFRINEGELVRTFIIPKGEKKDIYIMAHHLMCDGFGLFILVEDIVSNLQGKEVAYKPTKVLTKKEVIRSGDLTFKQRLGLKGLNQKWKKERQVFGWDDYYKIHEEYWKNKRTNLVMKEIESSELETIKKECKDMGITVNSYLFTKLLQENPECKNIGAPLSLRGEERSIANFVGSVTACYSYDASKSFEENAKVVDELLRKQLQSEKVRYHSAQFFAIADPTLIDAALMYLILGYENRLAEVMAHIIGYIGDTYTDLGVTNLKEITILSNYDRFKITNFIPVAPCILTSEIVVSISTYQGKMLIVDGRVKEI